MYESPLNGEHPIRVTLPYETTIRTAARCCAAYYNKHPLITWTLIDQGGSEWNPVSQIGEIFKTNQRLFLREALVTLEDEFRWPWR